MMVNRWCLLRRLIGGRRMIMRFETNYRYNNSYHIHTIAAATTTGLSSHLKISSCSFISFGLEYNWTANHPRYMSYQSDGGGKSECDTDKEKIIGKRDVVNISELLFTKDRDYLIRYNDPQRVTAEELAGKFIVIYFVPLYYDPDLYPPDRLFKESLMDTYDDLKFKNCFEVVMVVDDDTTFSGELGQLCPNSSLQRKFEDIFAKCPSWAAIPFSDITSRKSLKNRFGHFDRLPSPVMVLIDSAGWVLDTFPQELFQTYGSEAYPFDDDRIAFLKSKDKTAFSQRSLKELLGSSERDFVITNKGEEVPIHTLEDKVVALYFYEDGFWPDFFLSKLKMYYEELKMNQNFEVVLLYLYDTHATIRSTEDTFQKTFETMPWLALPYKDPVHKKLKRLFGYPDGRLQYYILAPTLVIVGTNKHIIGCRDIIEPGTATNRREYDVNLFLREEFAKAENERVRVSELKLEMLCSPDTIFKRKDGSLVQFAELAGKRVIILFEGDYPEYDGLSFRGSLEAMYIGKKGTAEEFEVIYIPNNKDENGTTSRVADMPWLISSAVELLPGCSSLLSFYGDCDNRYHSSLLLAFGRNGSLVRRTICPWFGDDHFPFYADGVDTEAFDIEHSDFCWGYWDTLYQGLLRYSRDQIKFPSADYLFCVYYY